jgi:hypothetical protein
MALKSNKEIYDLYEKAKSLGENKELVVPIHITDILKKRTYSNDSFCLQGYEVDHNICPPLDHHRWPPTPNVSNTNPLQGIQRIFQIDVKHEILDRIKNGENIVQRYLNSQSVATISLDIRLEDRVSLNPH